MPFFTQGESNHMFQQILQKVINKSDLTAVEAGHVLETLMKKASSVQTASFLTALTIKGETSQEIAGFVRVMRKNMLTIKAPANAIDVCGTGGDGKRTYNISTTVAFVVAGVGLPVVKHGNRAASSKSGSADVLEALGVTISLSPKQAESVLNKTGMVFLFAPLYHPSMKQVAIVRKELKIPTVFNILGPLANPAGVKYQLIGVSGDGVAEKLLPVVKALGYKRLGIVVSDEGFDEVGLSKDSHLYLLEGKRLKEITIHPQKLGFVKADVTSLQGNDPKTNAKLIEQVLSGAKGPKRDIVVLNAAVALYIAGKAKSIQEGVLQAQASIDSGKALMSLENLRRETKKYESKN